MADQRQIQQILDREFVDVRNTAPSTSGGGINSPYWASPELPITPRRRENQKAFNLRIDIRGGYCART